MIVFLDPSIFISYLLSSRSERVIPFIVKTCISSPKIKLSVSQIYINELLENIEQNPFLKKPKLQKHIEEFAKNILQASHEPEVAAPYSIIKTTKQKDVVDSFVTLIRQSDYVVTGDDELLEHKKIRTTSVVNPAQFYMILAQEF